MEEDPGVQQEAATHSSPLARQKKRDDVTHPPRVAVFESAESSATLFGTIASQQQLPGPHEGGGGAGASHTYVHVLIGRA